VTNLLTFVFFFLLKRRCFDLKKKIDPANPVTRSNLVTRPKPGTRALDRASHRAESKHMLQT
jgi:hypothetical protein